MTPHDAPRANLGLLASTAGLFIVAVNCAFVEANTIRSRGSSAGLILNVGRGYRGTNDGVMALIEAFEGLCSRIES